MTNDANNETRQLCRPCLDANGEDGGATESTGECARCGAAGVATFEVVWDANLEAGAACHAMTRTVRALIEARRAGMVDISVARDFRRSLKRASDALHAYLDEREDDHG